MATFSVYGARDPFADFLNLAPTSLSDLESENLQVGDHAEDTLLDDGARVRLGHLDIGAVVCCVNGVLVLRLDFVMLICLELVQVCLIPKFVAMSMSPSVH